MNDSEKYKDSAKKKTYDAITQIDDDLIEEARPQKAEVKQPNFKKWLAAAAAVLLVVFIAPQLLNFSSLMPRVDPSYTSGSEDAYAPQEEGQAMNDQSSGNKYGPLLAVSYPKGYGFEDSDSWIEIFEQTELSGDFLKSVNNFSLRTAAAVLENNPAGKNVNFSPLSLYYALAIASSGAESETADELLELLGTADVETLNEQSNKMYRRQYFDNEMGKFQIANSLWLDKDMNGEAIIFKDDFVKNAADNYYAGSYNVDFADPATADAMAAWIAENTNNTLKPELEIDPAQILSIINTVYFRDQWVDRFNEEKTEADLFYLANGGEVEVDFMNSVYGTAGFYRGEGYTRASLGLKNSEMVFILPDEGVSPYELIATSEKLDATFNGGEEFWGEVVWQVPKFSFASKLDLKETLQNLGIESAFLPEADFSGITDHLAYISALNQETHIAINEEGVEASAFTHIAYAGAAPPSDRAGMILDRPFIFAITTNTSYQTGEGDSDWDSVQIPIFVGICEDPTA
ncbi:MAG: serpin family protein [Eubacteriales bacterium]|nr:serpin family protein [Eubacteriales bacterium]